MARTKLEPFTGVVRYPVIADLGLNAAVGGYHTMNIWRQSQTPEEIMHKFAHCFRKVWEQIPGADCDTLITHWGLRDSNESSTFSSDVITLKWKLKFHSPYSFYRGKYDYALGQCDLSGLHLYFSSWFIKIAGFDDLEYLIAHELGHAISFARGWFKHHACDDDTVICTACECEADRYAMSWGYDCNQYLHSVEMPRPRCLTRASLPEESSARVVRRRRHLMDPWLGY